MVGSPNVNIARDPRWGRAQETPGEDPTLNGVYAARFIAGFQSGNHSSVKWPRMNGSPLMASSCAKHYFAYNLENCYQKKDNCRLNFDSLVSQQEIEDTFLPGRFRVQWKRVASAG
eukprot:2075515-Prymnesium_polylepis.2